MLSEFRLKQHLIIMGVAGCGKTTLGRQLAADLSVPFYDGDDFHSAASVRKMSEGKPLTNADRQPWLKHLNEKLRVSESPVVLACSALREEYRQTLADQVPVVFVYLDISKPLAVERIAARDHFFPDVLIDSQFETLEVPAGSNVIQLASHLTPEQARDAVLLQLQTTTNLSLNPCR